MIKLKKIFIAGVAITAIFAGLFYLFPQRNNEDIKTENIIGQPIVSWQKTTITEAMNNSIITINSPRMIIYGNYNLESKVNEAIMQQIEYSKDWFISGVTTVAEEDKEANILDIDTEILLMTPRLISL